MLSEKSEIDPFNSDFTNKASGACELVLSPESEEEVSAILSYCND